MKSNKKKLSKYWTDSKKEKSKDIFIKEAYLLSKKLVPNKGEANTIHGEIMRNIQNYIYDLYNNGLMNYDVKHEQFENIIQKIENETIKISAKSKTYFEDLKTFSNLYKENQEKSTKPIEEAAEIDCKYCNGNDEDCKECGGEGWYIDYDNWDDTTEQEEHEEIYLRPALKKLFENADSFDSLIDDIVKYVYKEEYGKILKEKQKQNKINIK